LDKFIKGVGSMRLLDVLDEYDEHISLGGTCKVALKLKELGHRKGSYPFDWIVIDVDTIVQLTENKFDGWTARENMKHCRGEWYTNTKYNTGHKHEFKEAIEDRGDHLYEFTNNEQFAKWQEEKNRRASRFMELLESEKKVLFIRRSRMARTGGGYLPRRLDPLKELKAARSFTEYLECTYPKLNFNTLFINTGSFQFTNWITHDKLICVSEYQWNAL
jgi:hypothetical protein